MTTARARPTIGDMWPYLLGMVMILLGTIASEAFIKDRRKRKLVEIVGSSVILLFFLGLRNRTVGNDTGFYVSYYESMPTLSWRDLIHSPYELGFVFFTKLVSLTHLPYTGYLVVYYAICLGLLGIFVYRFSVSPGVSYYCFFALGFFTFFMSGMRQSMAICLCLLAFVLAMKQKVVPFLIAIALIGVAFFFHRSAVFAIVLLWVPFFLRSKATPLFFGLFGLIAVTFGFFIVFWVYYPLMNSFAYLESYQSPQFTTFGFSIILYVLLLALYFLFTDKNRITNKVSNLKEFGFLGKVPLRDDWDQDQANEQTFSLAVALYFGILFLIFNTFLPLVSRAGMYSTIVIIALIPNFLALFKQRSIRVIGLSILILGLPAYLYWTTFRLNYLSLLPFRFFFQQ